jgi:hypothetical protein
MATLALADGTQVEVIPPSPPRIGMAAPAPANVLVVPARGERGEQGPPGDSSATLSYHHTQITTSDTWTINHNLGYNPAGIVIRDSSNSLIECDNIAWPNVNTVVITFYPGRALSGSADLS